MVPCGHLGVAGTAGLPLAPDGVSCSWEGSLQGTQCLTDRGDPQAALTGHSSCPSCPRVSEQGRRPPPSSMHRSVQTDVSMGWKVEGDRVPQQKTVVGWESEQTSWGAGVGLGRCTDGGVS